MQRAAGAALAIGASVSATTWAQAACNLVGTTVTCSGTISAAGTAYGTGFETGLTVNVLDGASLTATGAGSVGIWLSDNATINNGVAAAITGVDAGIAGAYLLSVTNQSSGTIDGGIYGVTGYNTSVNNSGTITGASTAGVHGALNAAVVNNAGGVVSGARGISSSYSGLVNYGRVTGDVDFAVHSTATVNVSNFAIGTIVGEVSAISSVSGTVNNYGSIIGTTGAGIAAMGHSTVNNYAGGRIVGSTSGIAAGGALVFNHGSIAAVGANGTGVVTSSALTLFNYAGGSITGTDNGIVASQTDGGSWINNAGTISGGVAAIVFGSGSNTLALQQGSVISGNVIGTGSDTLQLGGDANASFDISRLGDTAQYRGFSTLAKFDRSVWTLTGTSTYTGAVNVKGGTLAVNGDLSAASLLTVDALGVLGGTGVLGATDINGGTLTPGNSIGTLTMSSLTMTAASSYLVEVSGAASDKTVVTGSAAVAGKVTINPLARLSSTTTYTIINAGTLTGTFSNASVTNNFARNARLSYVGGDVLLTLDPGLLSPILPDNAAVNHRNVAAGIDNALMSNATLPTSFNALFALSGTNLLNALTQVSGETATGAQQTTVDAMTQFMGMISDPFTAGRGGNAPGVSSFAAESDALAYAPDGRKRTRAERDAYAMFTKAKPQTYQPRWNVWAAGFGGSRTTDGNATLGSNRTTGSIAGGAVGADHWFSPDTVAGLALAGGGTSFSVANGGSGQSDLFQAGAFVRHTIASSYITATAAYGWQDIRTDRLITAAGTDRLRANFNANSYSGRLEAGYRWALPGFDGLAVTPYVAAQVTAFDLPSYAETSLNGAGGFALNYAGKTVTATRSEFGLRADTSYALADALLTLRGRAAWAHDYNTDRNVAAMFQSLPGSNFVVNGANAKADVALTSASAELAFAGGWSVAATFDGEFASTTRSYAGKGAVRYAW